MKLVLFNDYQAGVLKGDSVVDISDMTRWSSGKTGREVMVSLMAEFDFFRPHIQTKLGSQAGVPLSQVKLRAPIPDPGKIMCMAANYLEFTSGPALPISGFLVSPDAVMDTSGTAVLPDWPYNICHHEAELVAVIGKEGHNIPQSEAMSYIFGYTGGVDVSCRDSYNGSPFLGKSYDGFKPLGPCITTADEIGDPHSLQIRLSVDGELRQDYNTSDMGHRIPECIAFFSSIMTIKPGDLLFLGTNHQGLGPLQDGDTAELDIEKIGKISFHIRDPKKRSWPKGVDASVGALVRKRLLEAAGKPA